MAKSPKKKPKRAPRFQALLRERKQDRARRVLLDSELIEHPLPDSPGATGALIVGPADDISEADTLVLVSPDATTDDREALLEWAISRLERLHEHGPGPDGWGLRSDGGRQLVMRRVVVSDPS